MMAGLAAGAVPAGSQAGASAAVERMASTVEREWPAGVVTTVKNPGVWAYEEGVMLDGMAAEWELTRDSAVLAYVRAAVDRYVGPEGRLRMDASGKPFDVGAHSLDNIEMGRAVLFLYRQTHDPRYLAVAGELHAALAAQPRTASGGYWHKQIYPNQIWLDGAYMAEPFRAAYAAETHAPGEFDDIAKQFLLMAGHMRDAKSGLLRHGWDESHAMPWADKTTGLSPEVWARAMGWYVVALADTLDWYPADHPLRKALEATFTRTMGWVMQYQDPQGLWWEVMDKGNVQTAVAQGPGRLHPIARKAAAGNFPEASASCMFVYAIAKGVRRGLLPAQAGASARLGWQGIAQRFIRAHADDDGVTLTGTVKGAGLGGSPYRSGSYDYYVGEAVGEQDSKGVGVYLLAGSEIARMEGVGAAR